jgi:predicted esterase
MKFKPTILAREESDLHLPRILCLHGGGTNARIFRAQCRGILKHLQDEFRFVFAQAPFLSIAGPDVLSVYKEWGPFQRWLLASPGDAESRDTVTELDRVVEDAMNQDTMKGATGEWVGVLGFSQGAKLAASLLYRQQESHSLSKTKFRFGVLLAGSAPLAQLDPDCGLYPDSVLSIPTIHMHGLHDPGLHRHRQLYASCRRGTARLLEWDGHHRIPIKTKDLLPLVQQIRELAGDADTGWTSWHSLALDSKPLVSCLEVEV